MDSTTKNAAALKPAEPVTVKLSTPVEWAKELVSEVKINPPTGRDLRASGFTFNGKGLEAGDLLSIAEQASEFGAEFFDRMSLPDSVRVAGVVADFLGDGQATGNE